MRLLDSLVRGSAPAKVEQRYTYGDIVDMLFNGSRYALGGMNGSNPELPDNTFLSQIATVHRRNGPVSSAVVARALLMSQLRFTYRRDRSQTKRGELWGDRNLSILERPGAMTRPELLFRAELHASYSGNAYIVNDGGMLRLLRPDHVTFLLGSDSAPTWDKDVLHAPYDAETIGIVYNPEHAVGQVSPSARVFMKGDYAHWMPEPDPVDFWRGASWVTSVVREIVNDGQATDHTSKYFEHAATPNLVFMMDPTKTPDMVRAYADIVNENHAGAMNSFKNMFLGGGTDVKVVGTALNDIGMKDIQGGVETRIAMRSRVPAVVLGAREGLSGSSLNTGNYSAARRLLADGWFSPTAANLCAALEPLVPVPSGSELWYDPSEVLFLQEDQKDAADIMQTNAVAMRQLVEAGYDPSTVIEAITTGDMSKLSHTGNVSVQLQPPGSGTNNDE
jgi:hypothetical protein